MGTTNNISNRIFIATMCGHWKQIADDFGVGIELDYFCQSQNMDGAKGEKLIEQAKSTLNRYKAGVMHAPFNELFPAAIDPKARELAMDRLNRAAEIAADLGIKKMVVHSGYMPFVYFKEWHMDRSVEFWTEFMDGKPDDFEICIENVLDDEPYMLAEIAERIGDRRVGLCYDVGHANIKGKTGFAGETSRLETTDQDTWLEVMGPHLKHLHIHNNDGIRDYHRRFAEGTIDIGRIIDGVIKNCGDDVTFTAEILSGEESFLWLRDKGYIG